ncbi:MAG: carboxypeptidase regulatory-like domain-containing protein [Acidobacteriota bacterium]
MLIVGVLIFAMLGLAAPSTFAQSGSGIAGVVKDTSGAVLPGVTVEASSPALIEKVRTAVTDGSGQYKIVGLVPGVYAVSFTLTGFTTVRRERVELTASFTATVNADLRVGSLQETITVTGETPTVDVQNVVQQRVMTRDIISAVPAGMRSAAQLAVLIPGVTTNNQDVGGTAFSASAIAIHGSRLQEQTQLYDGMNYNNGQGRGGNFIAIVTNDATVSEISLETSGLSAESETSGVRTNLIPRDGGNTFKGLFIGSFANHDLQSNNLNDDLKATGLTSVTTLNRTYDADPAWGGPIKKDRLWFWGSVRAQASEQSVAGIYYNLTPTGHAYTPDTNRPADSIERNQNESLRLTLQATPRNKITLQHQNASQQRPYYGYSLGQLTNAPEAIYASKSAPMYQSQGGWSSPVTSKLLFEAGVLYNNKDYPTLPQPDNAPNQVAWRDLGSGFSWGNYGNTYGHNASHNFNTRFTASYVTGSHALKAGVTYMHLWAWTSSDVVNDGMTLQLRNASPTQVTVFATPLNFYELLDANWGLFVQDQWTLKRLTVNAGVRFDALRDLVPAQTIGPGPQVPTRNLSFDAVDNVPNWKDATPRLGLSYDLFGSGKTAAKFSFGKYLEGPNPPTYTRPANPAGAIVQSATRTWSDRNGDFVPQADELGALNPSNFGAPNISTRYADDVLVSRGYNWEIAAQVAHELMPRVSLNAGYFRRWFGNFTSNDNLSLGPADFDPYCATAPLDARLPGGGGYAVCGLYDQKRIVTQNTLISKTSNFGTQTEIFNGVDLSVNARLPRGVVASGGASVGRVATNNCFVVDSPQALLNCDVTPPFQPNVKALAIYPLPWWGLQTSATFQSLPGPQITASRSYSSADVSSSLGHNLLNGTANVPLIKPGTLYAERLYQVDFRASKSIKMPRGRVQVNVDLYNAFNASSILAQNTTYGALWLRPTQILQGRLLKFGGQIDF